MTPPKHVAIIMDGNGRWAQSRNRPRVFGHIRGAKVARQIIEECTSLGVKHLTLFAFSTENWRRPSDEVSLLMKLLRRHLVRERATLMKNGLRFQTIGEVERLPAAVREEIEKTKKMTAGNTGMVLTFALSYGGRQDLTQAMTAIAEDIAAGKIKSADVTEDLISSRLSTAGQPDPDLIIRTSGEMRISNFMLWQAAYSELYITPIAWPDFDASELRQAFETYSRRERRYGMTSSQTQATGAPGLL